MITREKILDSIKFVVDNSEYVKINIDNLENAINLLDGNKNSSWLDNEELDIKSFSDRKKILYLILCESLNFCYWDTDVKWKIEYNGEWYSGSFGLFYAILKAILNGYDLLDRENLENLTIDGVDEIFMGTTSIPLLKERYEIIRKLALELKEIKNLNELFQVDSDIELLNVIINNFSNFRDISLYKGHQVYFFKRAILLVGDLISNVSFIGDRIKNDNNMTGCADYKIPQVLRHLGILEYDDRLKQMVDSGKEIEHDSEMEIEIRANMLYVIELIRERMNQRGINLNSVQIDNALWLLSKREEFKDKPHHLTRTIYY